MSVFIYTATRRETGDQYVGLSKNPVRRWKQHETDSRYTNRRSRFHRALAKHGLGAFEWQVVAELPTLEEAQLAERILIAVANPTYNLTAGGEGTLGYSPTPETREKQRIASTGRVASPETRAKRSAALTGFKHSDEARSNMSAAAKGKKISQETCSKMSASQMGHAPTGPSKHSEETRAKMSASHKARWARLKTTAEQLQVSGETK